MSWDVVVCNFQGSPPDSPEELPDELEPLGTAAAVRDSISKYLPGVNWTDARSGDYSGEGFNIELSLDDDDPVETVMLSVHGGGDPLSAIMSFVLPNNWSLLDGSTGAFLDLDDPSQAGWEGFQEYRDAALGEDDT